MCNFSVASSIAFSERYVRSHISLHCKSQIPNFEKPVSSFSYHTDTWTHIYRWKKIICLHEWSERRGWELRVLLRAWLVVIARHLWLHVIRWSLHSMKMRSFFIWVLATEDLYTESCYWFVSWSVRFLAISILPNTLKYAYSACYMASLKI
jgi:hypothetical protein